MEREGFSRASMDVRSDDAARTPSQGTRDRTATAEVDDQIVRRVVNGDVAADAEGRLRNRQIADVAERQRGDVRWYACV